MDRRTDGFIRVASIEELAAKGMMTVPGQRCPILVIHHAGRVHAVDNRCPHLGFPLERGTIEDGILTCHWHHARFDLESGGTFDLWADDLPTVPVELRGGDVWVLAEPGPAGDAAVWRARLADAMAHNLGLVAAKSVQGALAGGVTVAETVRDAALFGAWHRDGWGVGNSTLTALARIVPGLGEEDTYLALLHGVRAVAEDCDGAVPRIARRPLGSATLPRDTLRRWLRRWTQVRHRGGAERTLLTAIAGGASPAALAEMLLTAATDRAFADTGHVLDFINKACECLDLIGWRHAGDILASLIPLVVDARGGEEMNAWRHPLDLVPLMQDAFAALPARLARGRVRGGDWRGHAALADALLGDQPAEIVGALDGAIEAGAAPADLGKSLAFAAAFRVARFGAANELADWNSAHHTFTYANALHRCLERVAGMEEAWEPVRGVYHGALALYLNRYLNIPPARLPEPGAAALDDLPAEAETLCAALLDAFDRQNQVILAARIVARYLGLGLPAERLIATLAHGVLRENARFHSFQMFEAALGQYRAWGDRREGHIVLIGLARFLAATAPSDRAQYQTATTARKLHRGAKLYLDEP